MSRKSITITPSGNAFVIRKYNSRGIFVAREDDSFAVKLMLCHPKEFAPINPSDIGSLHFIGKGRISVLEFALSEEFLDMLASAWDSIQDIRRLNEIKKSIAEENISYGEIAELPGLVKRLKIEDPEILEAAGVPEFPLTTEEMLQDFLEVFHPDYFGSDDVALFDDYCKIVDGELNGSAEALYLAELAEQKLLYGDEDVARNETIKIFNNLKNEAEAKLYREAIANFIRQRGY